MLASFLPRGLDFHLESWERDRLIVASTLPIFVVLANVALFVLEVIFNVPYGSNGFDKSAEYKAYALLASAEGRIAFAALAALIFVGISRPTYGVGSWSCAIALAGIGLAIVLALFSSVPYAFLSPYDGALVKDWHTNLAARASTSLSLSAAGYAFLAYRGLNSDESDVDDDEPEDEIEPDYPSEL